MYKTTHENSVLHRGLLEERAFEQQHPAEDSSSLAAVHAAERMVLDDSVRQLLASLSGHSHPSASPPSNGEPLPTSEDSAPPGINWGLFAANEDTTLSLPDEVTTVLSDLYLRYDSEDSEDGLDLEERQDEDVEEVPITEPSVSGMLFLVHTFEPCRAVFAVNNGDDMDPGSYRKRMVPDVDESQRRRHWFPWHDKIVSSFTI